MPCLYFAWTDAELDEAILKLCDEFPTARMADCSRALEHCRRSTPRGTPESLLAAMRDILSLESSRPVHRGPPRPPPTPWDQIDFTSRRRTAAAIGRLEGA